MFKRSASAFLVFLTASIACNAGELVVDASILEVANTNTGDASFAVKIQGGTGVCAGSSVWIVFPEVRKASDASYNQAFAAALAALASDMKVRIHNFVDNSCGGATFISISK